MSLLKQVDQRFAIVILLIEGVMEQDHTRDGLDSLWRRAEKDLAPHPPVLGSVLLVDLGQAVAHGAAGLVGSQDTLAGGHNGLQKTGVTVSKMGPSLLGETFFTHLSRVTDFGRLTLPIIMRFIHFLKFLFAFNRVSQIFCFKNKANLDFFKN